MKILVISPTFNEKKNVSKLIEKIFNLGIKLDVLIIDDNSPDGTGEAVKKLFPLYPNLKLLERTGKLGLGTAYCEGFIYAINNKYDYIIQIDADLSHNPEDIIDLLKMAENYDLVIGSRYINGVNVINWPISRLLLSYFANLYARLFTALPIFDLTGGYKCFNRKVLESLDLTNIRSEGYSFQIEINFLTHSKSFSIKEIPIIFTDRTVGESKMNRSIVFEAIILVPKLFIKRFLK